MPQVRVIIDRKGSRVFAVQPNESVLDAALMMNQEHIGAVIVLDGSRVHGMFTERDVLRRVVAQRKDPAALRVSDVMTSDVVTCHPDADLDEARKIFKEKRIRHLPVVDENDTLVGMISIGDLNAWDLTGQEIKIQALEQVIYGQS